MKTMRTTSSQRLTPWRGPFKRRLGAYSPLLAIAAIAACCAGALARESLPARRALAARTISVRDESTVHFLKSSGSSITDEGPATGTIPGRVRIRFVYDGNPSVDATITIFGHAGTLVAHGSGKLSSPTSPTPSFKGVLAITSGTGRYARAHGSGELFGVFYRRSYGMIVQTKGTLRY
jgi:hypothetical protein